MSERNIDHIGATAMLDPTLRHRLVDYKQNPAQRLGWGLIWGRLVIGHLEAHHLRTDVDRIIANPTWTGANATSAHAHAEQVVEFARTEDAQRRWTFDRLDDPTMVLTGPTPRSRGSDARSKREAARQRKALLDVRHPDRVAGMKIVVYDDVCTTGWQLDACAEKLREHGAVSVSAIVIARAPWIP